MPRRSLLLALLGSTAFFILALAARDRKTPVAVAVVAPPAAKLEEAETVETAPSRDVDRIIARVGALEFRLVRDLADVGGDHPIADTHYAAVNIETKKAVALTDIVSESELVASLMESPAMARALTDDEGESAPLRQAHTLKEFEEALQPLSLRFAFSNECETQDLKEVDLKSFAIVDFDSVTSRMAVHLALQTASPQCNGDFPRLRVTLKAPANLIEPLRRAKLGEKGFFAPAAERKVCDTCTEGEVSTGFFVGA